MQMCWRGPYPCYNRDGNLMGSVRCRPGSWDHEEIHSFTYIALPHIMYAHTRTHIHAHSIHTQSTSHLSRSYFLAPSHQSLYVLSYIPTYVLSLLQPFTHPAGLVVRCTIKRAMWAGYTHVYTSMAHSLLTASIYME